MIVQYGISILSFSVVKRLIYMLLYNDSTIWNFNIVVQCSKTFNIHVII